jgi:hypothetical protein
MGWREFELKSNAVTNGLTCLILGVALGSGRIKGVNLDLSTFLAAGFTCVGGVAFLLSAKVQPEQVEACDRWAYWFLGCGLVTMIAKMCF